MVPAQHWQPLFWGSQDAPSRPQQRRPDKPAHSGLPATPWRLMRPEPLQHFFLPPHFLSLSLQRFFLFFPAARSFTSSRETRPVSPAAAPTRSAWRRWAALGAGGQGGVDAIEEVAIHGRLYLSLQAVSWRGRAPVNVRLVKPSPPAYARHDSCQPLPWAPCRFLDVALPAMGMPLVIG